MKTAESIVNSLEKEVSDFHERQNEAEFDWMPIEVPDLETLLSLARWALVAREAFKKHKVRTCSCCADLTAQHALESFPNPQNENL